MTAPGSDPRGHDPQQEPSEEELRARLEEELARITVKDVLVQTLVTLVNIGGHRLGITETTRENRDPEQAKLAIEAVRALLPVLEADPMTAQQVRPVRDALAQLQLAYAREFGSDPVPGQPTGEAPPPEGPPGGRPSKPSGLWVPPGTGGG